MSDWKKIENDQYFYRGFYIHYSMDIIDRRAVDVMRAIKELPHEQKETEKISLKTTGNDFEEVKETICGKIDAFHDSNS